MATSQPEDAPAIQDFLQWISNSENFRTGCKGSDNAIGSRYIPRVALDAYLTTGRIRTLLVELFDNTNRAPDADRVRTNYLRPFAILLSAGFGRWIRHFVDHRYEDSHLPFSSKPRNFPQSTTQDLFNEFCKKQWQFCAMQLDYDMSDHLENDCILPILGKEDIERGGSAILYKITVDKDYNNLIPAGHSDRASQVSARLPEFLMLINHLGGSTAKTQNLRVKNLSHA